MSNPIVERELIGLLRTRKAFLMLLAQATVFALLVLLRWPTDALVDLFGAQSRQVFTLFGYGLLTTLILLVPVFPATTIIREKQQGTLALLLNSPMSSWSIYFGKLTGELGFVVLLLAMTVPAAVACYAMGGISLWSDVVVLYVILAVVSFQYAALGLLVSTCANSTDSALRITYGLVLLMSVVTLGPHYFLQGTDSAMAERADLLRCVSPIPAVMDVLGHGDVGSHGTINTSAVVQRYFLLALASTAAFLLVTVSRLNHSLFDRSRAQGVMTDERGTFQRWVRRFIFLVDPQRRKSGIGPLTNPVMVKEFRCRRFGRSHWILRLIAICALISLTLTYATTMGTTDWGVETIGGIIATMQVALIVLLTPSLAAGLISTERESGGWDLLKMTPMSPRAIVTGKLMSAVWTLLLILCATLPGYAVMIYIKPVLQEQITQVLICLVLTAVFAIIVSATVSSFFRQTAPATITAYTLLVLICAGTMLVWLGRDAPFAHRTVETVLTVNPLAAALSVMQTPGFTDYELIPANWWFVGACTGTLLLVLLLQIWRLTRPQ